MILPLRIALLWHQHQPYYRKGNHFILPWVRLHAAKDYWDLPALAEQFPSLKQTINIVPSLLVQLDEYIRYGITDTIQELTLINANELSRFQKKEILRLFFLCNYTTMIAPYTRYHELYSYAVHNQQEALDLFSSQDWLDIQTWYNLTWIGELFKSNNSELQSLFKKAHFSEADKVSVLDYHKRIIRLIIPIMQKAVSENRLELSVTPFYHPIIPLLIDSYSALENLPQIQLPRHAPQSVKDAQVHIERALAYCKDRLSIVPNGMWPSEGSISNESLSLFEQNNIKWIATDEKILFQSPGNHHQLDKYFPRKIGKLVCYFRDHALSDAIGFEYSSWNTQKAIDDFINRLQKIRLDLIQHYGEHSLEYAVVPIILDGENCWEYYQNNGLPFLQSLFHALISNPELLTITMTEGIQGSEFLEPLSSIKAGSWIHGNFSIWIGHPQDNAAWEMIAKARERLFDCELDQKSPEWQKAYNHLLISEGSDWFWWYGDDHISANQSEFDELFRWNIEQIYLLIGHNIPDEVRLPISDNNEFPHAELSSKNIIHTLFEKEYSGSAIHSVSEILSSVHICFHPKSQLFTFNVHAKDCLGKNDSIEIYILTDQHKILTAIWKDNYLQYDGFIPQLCGSGMHHIYFSLPDTLQIFQIRIKTLHNTTSLQYPRSGEYKTLTL
jgi:alpha-amylase/alpha-mannosidase (GH57 family)